MPEIRVIPELPFKRVFRALGSFLVDISINRHSVHESPLDEPIEPVTQLPGQVGGVQTSFEWPDSAA